MVYVCSFQFASVLKGGSYFGWGVLFSSHDTLLGLIGDIVIGNVNELTYEALLKILHTLTHLIFTPIWCCKYCYSHFEMREGNKDTETLVRSVWDSLPDSWATEPSFQWLHCL